MLALDELEAYNKGKRDMLDDVQKMVEHYKDILKNIDDKFDKDKEALMKEYDIMKSKNNY